jgi:CDGSH iron-sulfur domain-containing protein 3
MPVTIRLRPNGPMLIEGEFTILDHEGHPFPIPTNKPTISLCRCGESKNKPFCDGSHKACNFAAVELAPPPPPAPATP